MRSINVQNLQRKITLIATASLPLFFFALNINAQTKTNEDKKNLIGVGGGLQLTTGFGLAPTFNLSYERKFTAHSSIETGLKFSIYYNHYAVSSFGSNETNIINDNYRQFSVPLLYKFNSNIFYIAGGPTFNKMYRAGNVFDYSNSMMPKIQKDMRRPFIGYQFKLGKTFNLSDRLVLEPEVSILGSKYFKKPQGEVNVGFKYRF